MLSPTKTNQTKSSSPIIMDISSNQQFLPSSTTTTHHHHPQRKNVFILKSLTVILSLTFLVLLVNYFLISNCPKLADDADGTLQKSQTRSEHHHSDGEEFNSNSVVISEGGDTTKSLVNKLTISIYYEILCPDSKHFILNQLLPVYKKFGGELLSLRFVPFGKGKVQRGGDGGGYQLSCQHGPEECHGNKLHACLTSNLKNDSLSLQIISCSMERYKLWAATTDSITKVTRECVKKYVNGADDHDSIMFCEKGDELLAGHGYETLGLKPSASFIPTIGVDGSLSNQRQILRDFNSVICDKLKASKNSELITC